MNMIPIPQEAVEKTVRRTKLRVNLQLRAKLEQKSGKRDENTLKRTTLKMSKYLIKKSSQSARDIDSLIDDMYRSIIALQKRKAKLQKYKKRRI